MKEVLCFTKKKNPVGTHLSEKPTNKTKIDKVRLEYDCVDGSNVMEDLKGIFCFFAPVLHLAI